MIKNRILIVKTVRDHPDFIFRNPVVRSDELAIMFRMDHIPTGHPPDQPPHYPGIHTNGTDRKLEWINNLMKLYHDRLFCAIQEEQGKVHVCYAGSPPLQNDNIGIPELIRSLDPGGWIIPVKNFQ